MRKAMVASALIHFGLIAGAWAALNMPPAADESDAESVSVSIISIDMVSTDPSEAVTQTNQTLVSAGEQHEAREVPKASEAEPVTEKVVETAEAVEVEATRPVEQAEIAEAPTKTVTRTAESEDLVSAEVLTAAADSPHPVEAAIPEVTSEVATVVARTVAPSQSDPLKQLRTASISELTPEAPAQKLPPTLVKPVEAMQPVQTANLQPVEEIEETAKATPIPLPPIKRKPLEAAKPQEQPVEQPKKKAEPKKQAEPKPKQQQPSKQANLGNGGAAQADTTASSRSGGGQGKRDDGGSAAASKYEGQVQSKVNRAVKKVATGRGGRGILRFALSANGSVLSVSILDSSGDPAVDAAAVAAVQRAAPYPAIPPATGKASWSFGLPFGDK